MKHSVFCRKLTAVFMCLSAGLFCACTDKQSPESPIRYGIAHVSGKVSGSLPFEVNKKTGQIILRSFNPLIELQTSHETYLQKDGTFVFDVPVACAGLGLLRSDFYYGYIYLAPNEKTTLEVSFDEKGKKHVNLGSSSGLTAENMINLRNTLIELLDAPPTGIDGILSPEEYSKDIMERIEKMEGMVKKHTELPESAILFIINNLKLPYLALDLLDYEENMRFLYLDANKDADKNDFTPITPEKSYYAFLRYFDLNNPDYLGSGSTYFEALQAILADKVLNIPPIGDTPIEDWLKEVKAIIAEYIGADTGLFYDVLASNAYAKQFEDEMKPLSDKQKENIKKYYKNKSFVEVLFAKNTEVAKIAADLHKPVINETPVFSKNVKGTLVDAIIAKYKGKVVVVDFWATWCGPCLVAMKESVELKSEMQKKGVVFVYITGSSSPKELWKKKIATIGGEQYYLNGEEWESISYSNKYGFDGIPTYLLFDVDGELKHKITAYPGNAEMRQMIEELLP